MSKVDDLHKTIDKLGKLLNDREYPIKVNDEILYLYSSVNEVCELLEDILDSELSDKERCA